MLIDTIQRTSNNQNKISSSGILFFKDSTLNSWISTSSIFISFGINQKNISSERWLTTISPSNINGFRLIRDAVIKSVSVNSQTNTNCSFIIKRKNDPTQEVYNITLTNESGKTLDNVNLKLNKDDIIQCYLKPHIDFDIDYPEVNIEIFWRQEII